MITYQPSSPYIQPQLPPHSPIQLPYSSSYKLSNLPQSHSTTKAITTKIITNIPITVTTKVTATTFTTTTQLITKKLPTINHEQKTTTKKTLEIIAKKMSLFPFQKLIQELPTPPPYNYSNQNLSTSI